MQEAHSWPKAKKDGQKADDVELDTFARTDDSEMRPDGADEEEDSDGASDSAHKGNDAKRKGRLAENLAFICNMHEVQTVLSLPIFAISAAVAAQHPDDHHYPSAFNTFIVGASLS